MLSRCIVLIIIALAVASAIAQDRPERPSPDPAVVSATVRAASTAAVQNLGREVSSLPLGTRLTVAQFVRALDAQDELSKALQLADQIGEPRWTAETCQVQLSIPAQRLAAALKRIAASYPKSSPLSPADIDRAVDDWPARTFTAVGSSAAPNSLKGFRPRDRDRWKTIDDKAREDALMAAKNAAARRAMDSVAPVPLAAPSTIADAWAIPEVNQPVLLWLSSRPVTRVDFRDDMQVEVALAVEDREFFNEFREVIQKQKRLAIPSDAGQWTRIERDFFNRLQPAIGRAPAASRGGPQTVRVAAHRIPAHPPEWADQRLDVTAEAGPQNTKLRTGRKAEANAVDKLREQIEKLPLDQDLTIGQAARDDRRIGDAIARTLRRAKLSKIEYRSDGTAVAHVSADLRDLWIELQR